MFTRPVEAREMRSYRIGLMQRHHERNRRLCRPGGALKGPSGAETGGVALSQRSAWSDLVA
jgi:hypothetical protein